MNIWSLFDRLRGNRLLKSCPCTQAMLEADALQAWVEPMREQHHLHRKLWEYCYIAQALHERAMLNPGRCGLGFAVGQEPLAALFASRGCNILATDLAPEAAQHTSWIATNQHAASLEVLNQRGICPDALFRQRASFRFVDMRDLPPDLGQFDFVWSACALEHLGSLELGERFIFESLRYLKPGGVAVHTTEYNVSSNADTVTTGDVVLYRRQDIRRMARRLRSLGYKIALNFTTGDGPADRVIDKPPYTHEIHLKLELLGYVVTSFGLIIEKPHR